jgi:hypothetical protein
MDEREEIIPVVRRRRDALLGSLAKVATGGLRRAMGAGLVSTLLVVVGSVSFGALLWENAGGADASDATIEVALLAISALLALGLGFALWLGSSYAVSRRFGWDEMVLLRYDSLAYLALLVYPLVRVGSNATPGLAGWATLVAFLVAKLIPLARFVPAVRDVAIVYASTRAMVLAIGWVATATLPVALGHGPLLFTWLTAWAQWDGAHYLAIADRGYAGTDTAFFPLYPTLLRLGGALLHSDIAAGFVISNCAFLVGLWFLRDIAFALTGSDRIAGRTLWYLAIFPASLFFTAVYSESVFFALTVATFAQLERRNWLFAGMLGGFAAITRLAGVFLIVPFVIEIVATISANGLTWRGNRRQILDLLACAACIPLALLSFMVLEGLLTGDFLAFEHVQSHWQRALSPPWTSVWRSISLVATSHDRATVAVQAIELTFTAVVVVLIVDGARFLRPSYWWYAVFSFLVPLSTSSLMSVPRFAAVVFPLFIVLAIRGENPLIDRLVVAFSLPLLGLFTAFFVTGRWVA